jgi:hypothetical protein
LMGKRICLSWSRLWRSLDAVTLFGLMEQQKSDDDQWATFNGVALLWFTWPLVCMYVHVYTHICGCIIASSSSCTPSS